MLSSLNFVCPLLTSDRPSPPVNTISQHRAAAERRRSPSSHNNILHLVTSHFSLETRAHGGFGSGNATKHSCKTQSWVSKKQKEAQFKSSGKGIWRCERGLESVREERKQRKKRR
ncbi:hypothetical protein NQZ68_009120 [Dissostichus eleginoides]|nr:hypothetical protein NQZ68_009120 [Dissostichus eleginoides]